jgi:hypothetical protein
VPLCEEVGKTAQISHLGSGEGDKMRERILVLYGTTDGQARKVASAIAETFKAEGSSVDLVDAASGTDPTPELYAATVVTASIHAGGFQRRGLLAHQLVNPRFPERRRLRLAGIPEMK